MSTPQKVTLPAPRDDSIDLLIIAGEHSGDEHAAKLLREVLARDPRLKVAALGGRHLAAAGAQLIFDLTATSAIGLGEVLKKISFYRSLIDEVVRWIGEHRPRAVCFVDSSGLNLRIARALFERKLSARAGGPTKTLYYISPQIWASRAGRRFRMAEHLDGLAAIFPFEPACYADTKLPVEFIGHPFVARDYAEPVRFDPNGPILLLPGSRRQAVSRIFPVLLDGYLRAETGRNAMVLYPSESILGVLRASNPPANVKLLHVAEGEDATESGGVVRRDPVGASAVLTSSGTMSMHCALAGIPGAVVYRTDPLTYALGRLLVRVKHLGIANLLLGEAMYPEFIQGAARPERLADELRACLRDPARRERTAEQAARLRHLLEQPAQRSAAEWMLRQLAS
jgi:lipid-A-disaccharide synthase